MIITDHKTLNIDPVLAKQILDTYPYPRQRPLRPDYVTYYVRLMKNNEFEPYGEIDVAFAPNGDGDVHGYLVNGRHRLVAIIEAGCIIPMEIKYRICDSMNAVDRLYATFDNGAQRSENDQIRALDLETLLGFKGPDEVRRLGSAVEFIRGGFDYTRRHSTTPAQKLKLMQRYADVARVYYHLTGRTHGGKAMWSGLRRAPTMSVALITLDESAKELGYERVAEFWAGIAKDDGLKQGDPRKLVVNHLHTYIIRNSGKLSTAANTSARYVAHCFNKWMAGEQLLICRLPSPDEPFLIVGSQYKGK